MKLQKLIPALGAGLVFLSAAAWASGNEAEVPSKGVMELLADPAVFIFLGIGAVLSGVSAFFYWRK